MTKQKKVFYIIVDEDWIEVKRELKTGKRVKKGFFFHDTGPFAGNYVGFTEDKDN